MPDYIFVKGHIFHNGVFGTYSCYLSSSTINDNSH